MRCPRCGEPFSDLHEPCRHCHSRFDPTLVEELGHVTWLLEQVAGLPLNEAAREALTQHYLARQLDLAVRLELRPAPLNPEDVPKAWSLLAHRRVLLALLDGWVKAHHVRYDTAQELRRLLRDRIALGEKQLAGLPAPAVDPADELAQIDYLLGALGEIRGRLGFTSRRAETLLRTQLLDQRAQAEQRLGLGPVPAPGAELPLPIVGIAAAPEAPAPAPVPAAPAAPPPEVAAPAPAPAPRKPRPVPLGERLRSPQWRERFWRSLLSERTLQAMLFLGIFLLFSAAISFVIWGWRDFTAPLRIAIPTAFTALFFLLGWLVHTRTRMVRSGLALVAIAALLIPVDAYTVYVNLHVSPESGPAFWLVTSLICLAAYTVTTLVTRSGLFAYLVGTAAGSAVLALMALASQACGLSPDWRVAALAVLAALLVLLGEALERRARGGRWRVFAAPLGNLALLAAGVLMLLALGWRYTQRPAYDTLHDAMTVTWWLGGGIVAWGAYRRRSFGLAVAAAVALPLAAYMAQAAVLARAHANPAWHGLGLALLAPLYLFAAHRLRARHDKLRRSQGAVALVGGAALIGVAALWSLTDLRNSGAAASSHAVLAATALLAAWLWRRPALLYLAALFGFTSASTAMSSLHLTLPQIALGWSTLGIVYYLLALRIGRAVALPLPLPEGEYGPPGGSASFGHRADLGLRNEPSRRSVFTLREGDREGDRAKAARPLAVSGLVAAGLAMLPYLFPYDGPGLAYALGNALGLAAWGARLAHVGRPGFALQGRWRAVYHWLTALPLPFWVWLLWANRGPVGAGLPLSLAALAWVLVLLGRRLRRLDAAYRWPWYLTGLALSVVAPVVAFDLPRHGVAPALCLFAAAGLYLLDGLADRRAGEIACGVLVSGWGLCELLGALRAGHAPQGLALAVLVAGYLALGLAAERRRWAGLERRSLDVGYYAMHLLAAETLWIVASFPLNTLLISGMLWTDPVRLWGAGSLLVLGMGYGLYAWGHYRERWAFVAAWLVACGGGLLALVYSTGRGTLPVKAALGAAAFVLAERGLNYLGHGRAEGRSRTSANLTLRTRLRPGYFRLLWRLYRRPLLVTGWVASAAAIALALLRNLVLLGGGRSRELWAVLALSLMVALYAVSARFFRRVRFVWLAGALLFVPWTIMAHLGWLVAGAPRLPQYALSWAALAWLLFLAGQTLEWLQARLYAQPLNVLAHILLPFALLWGVADTPVSRWTFGVAAAFYALQAWRGVRRGRSVFLYPALGLLPVWSVYLLSWPFPQARHEHYGLLLLAWGPLGLAAGQLLGRLARPAVVPDPPSPYPSPCGGGGEEGSRGPADNDALPLRRGRDGVRVDAARQDPYPIRGDLSFALPAYITGYVAAIFGTLLTAHLPGWLAAVLVYDALLCLVPAWLFRNPLWVYPAAALLPLSLVLELGERRVPWERQGWWLTGLAALYLLVAWGLRRLRLRAYAAPALLAGLALVALGLPLSSGDRFGALCGYAAAAALYGLAAFWLQQPLLLYPACLLGVVPYALLLDRLALPAAYHGLALYPAAALALAFGWLLDARRGARRGFPWGRALDWPRALAERLAEWWALPLYLLGSSLAAAGPFFTAGRWDLSAWALLLATLLAVWGIRRFRLRGWLLAAGLAAQAAAVCQLRAAGWQVDLAGAALRFLPVTLGTLALAACLARRLGEGAPLARGQALKGWSRPLYVLAALDVIGGQALSLGATAAGAMVALAHALLLALLASCWAVSGLAWAALGLGVLALCEQLAAAHLPLAQWLVPLARLALAYGLAGYGLAWLRNRPQSLPRWLAVWERRAQRFSLIFSALVLLLTARHGPDLLTWSVRALLGLPFRVLAEVATVQRVVGVLALLGLLYIAAAYTYRRRLLGYAALAMLLLAWALHAFYVQQWVGAAQVQWYAMPAGLYLLTVSYLERRRKALALARWLDYAALVLMMGSLFWQTLLFGWRYALLLGAEGFVALWWGSASRLRRFLYAGVLGVILATVAQLINSLRSVNQWIVFGIIGLLVVVAAILVERRLEDIRAWRQSLDGWE